MTTTNENRPEFTALRYTHLKVEAELAAASAIEPAEWEDQLQSAFDEIVDRHTAALDAFLMAPAPDLRGLAAKLATFARHDIADGWHLGNEIADLLARDAARLVRAAPVKVGGAVNG